MAYDFAAPTIITVPPVAFGNRHVGDTITQQSIDIRNSVITNASFQEGLDAGVGGTTGGATSNGATIANLAAGAPANSVIKVGIETSTAGDKSGDVVLAFISDGSTTSLLSSTTLTSGTVAVTGAAYDFANPTLGTVPPVAFGNRHVGDAIAQQPISIQNSVITNASFQEGLDAEVSGTTGCVISNGMTIVNLSAGAAASGAITVGIDTASSGVKSGDVLLAFTSDGSTTSLLTPTALTAGSVAVTGTVYALATPAFDTTTLNFGVTRTGQAALTQAATISNGTKADAFQEALAYASGATPSGFVVDGNGSGTIVSGGNVTVGLSLGTGTAGIFSGPLAVGLISKAGGAGLSGKVYASAVAQLGTGTIDFGVVHVGDKNLSQALAINHVASGGLIDALTGHFGTVNGPFTGSDSLETTGSLSVALDTANAGVFNVNAPVVLASHDADQPDVAVSASPVILTATVNNFAVAAIEQTAGAGTFAQTGTNYTLDFGIVLRNSGVLTADLAVLNAAAGRPICWPACSGSPAAVSASPGSIRLPRSRPGKAIPRQP